MKRIGVFAAVCVILAVVIITGSSLIVPAVNGEKRETLEVTSASGTQEEVQIVITNEGAAETSRHCQKVEKNRRKPQAGRPQSRRPRKRGNRLLPASTEASTTTQQLNQKQSQLKKKQNQPVLR